MAFSRTHSATADATFSTTGATNWNAAHALTEAVSGGIPYGTSTTTESYSALLAANALVIGGGAGAAPSTVAALTWGPTAGQGFTAALGTATTDVGNRYTQTWNAAGVTFTGHKFTITTTASAAASLLLDYWAGTSGAEASKFKVDKNGNLTVVGAITGGGGTYVEGGYFVADLNSGLVWGANDLNIGRISAGLMGINNSASTVGFAGRIKLTSAIAAGVAVGSLNASPTTGEIQSVTDALSPVIGTTIGAGGSAKALVWYNGANWTTIGV